MKIFEVTITREIRCEATIEVEARNAASAMKRAKEMADSNGGRDFVEGDVLDEEIKFREIGGGK